MFEDNFNIYSLYYPNYNEKKSQLFQKFINKKNISLEEIDYELSLEINEINSNFEKSNQLFFDKNINENNINENSLNIKFFDIFNNNKKKINKENLNKSKDILEEIRYENEKIIEKKKIKAKNAYEEQIEKFKLENKNKIKIKKEFKKPINYSSEKLELYKLNKLNLS